MGKSARVLAALLGAAITATTPSVAVASLAHPSVVSEDPSDVTPHLYNDGSAGLAPRVYALAQRLGPTRAAGGGTVYAGGDFSAVTDALQTVRYRRSNLMAFDATTGAISAFAPKFNGPVWAVRATRSALFVGGGFTRVNGAPHTGLVKIDATTGVVKDRFQPPITSGRVSEIRLVDGRVLVGGTFRQKLLALHPRTGADTGYLDLAITGSVAGNSGQLTEVFRFGVDPARGRLVAVGNFTKVDGQFRRRAFMLNLGPRTASLNPWYYSALNHRCSSEEPTKQAYLEDVDFAPDGSYFVLVSTGFVPSFPRRIGKDICDAAARFETDIVDPVLPTWINYTGGDTLHSVAATGAAVYVQGHNRWLDNPYGRNSAGEGAVDRPGGGAIDPVSGKALPWNPVKRAVVGGYDFLATRAGLWVGSDGKYFHGEYHYGIAFCPL